MVWGGPQLGLVGGTGLGRFPGTNERHENSEQGTKTAMEEGMYDHRAGRGVYEVWDFS